MTSKVKCPCNAVTLIGNLHQLPHQCTLPMQLRNFMKHNHQVMCHANNVQSPLEATIQCNKREKSRTSRVDPYMGSFSPSTIISKGIVRTWPVAGSTKPSAGPWGSPVCTTKPSAAQHKTQMQPRTPNMSNYLHQNQIEAT